jgi:hypothetical protein
MKNHVASITTRLRNHAKAHQLEFAPLVEQFALGRLLARLILSPYADDFILKGAQLFRIWTNRLHRPTRDADFLSFGSADASSLERIFQEICASPCPDEDGLTWQQITAAPIREDNHYGGIRVKITALLGNIRIPIQIDVGFGDAITPGPNQSNWNELLDFPSISLRTYPPETVIAEKLEAAVSLGMANSRMKDFFDLDWLQAHQSFDYPVLRKAIQNTFERRQTPLPEDAPIALTPVFATDPNKVIQWNAFLRKSKLPAQDMEEVIQRIVTFLHPVLFPPPTLPTSWSPTSGWS